MQHITDILRTRPFYSFSENVTGLVQHEFFLVGLAALAAEGFQSRFYRYELAAAGVRQTRVRVAWLVASQGARPDPGGPWDLSFPELGRLPAVARAFYEDEQPLAQLARARFGLRPDQ